MNHLLSSAAGRAMDVAWPFLVSLTAGVAGWVVLLARHRRARLRLLDDLVGQWAEPGRQPQVGACPPDAPRATESEGRVLLAAPAAIRAELTAAIGPPPLVVDAADSCVSARVACDEAIREGRPYNLVLLDARLPDLEPGTAERLQAALAASGARVAVVGARRGDGGGAGAEAAQTRERVSCPAPLVGVQSAPGRRDGGFRSDENPDRRGRGGFAAAPPADAPQVGLRSRRRA